MATSSSWCFATPANTRPPTAAERIVDAVGRPCTIATAEGESAEVHVGASVGVCVQRDGMPFDEAVRLADEALGTAKQLGKGRYHIAVL